MRTKVAIVVAVALLSLSPVAIAGLRLAPDSGTVRILSDAGGGQFYGMFGDVRSSSNNVEYISCQTTARAGFAFAWCYARDATGLSTRCFTDEPELIAEIRSMPSDASILITYAEKGRANYCTDISTSRGSSIAPKTP